MTPNICGCGFVHQGHDMSFAEGRVVVHALCAVWCVAALWWESICAPRVCALSEYVVVQRSAVATEEGGIG